jgi:hypothetical protein
MSYQSKSKKLFEEWKKAVSEYGKSFISDGIVNEIYFQGTTPKVLFLMKESNDPSDEADWDLAKFFNKELKYNFARRISEWAWGIIKNFPPLEKASSEDLHNALKSTAIVNLKKSGGGTSTDIEVLKRHVKMNKEFLLKQIDLIRPNIIIGGLGQTAIWELFIENIKFINSGYDLKIARFNDFKIVDFYHPSYRVPRAMSYSLLMNVIKSSAFNKL